MLSYFFPSTPTSLMVFCFGSQLSSNRIDKQTYPYSFFFLILEKNLSNYKMKYLIVLVAYFAFASAIDSEKSEERTITSFIQSTGHSLSENLNI